MKAKLLVLVVMLTLAVACSESDNDGDSYVSTVADVGGYPDGVSVSESGNVYITDIGSGEVKQISPEGTVTVLDGVDAGNPDGIVAVHDSGHDVLYVADTAIGDPESPGFTDTGSIFKIEVNLETGVATQETFVDSTDLNSPTGIAIDATGNLYVTDQGNGDVYKIPVTGGSPGAPASLTSTGAAIDAPHGLALAVNEDNSITLYATDQGSTSNNVVKIEIPSSGNPADALVSEVTGESTGGTETGTVDTAQFDQPHGIARGGNGAVFVTDENNNRVQIITPGGNVVTFAGSGTEGDSDGKAVAALFSKPRGVAVEDDGTVLICDYGNGKVKRIVP